MTGVVTKTKTPWTKAKEAAAAAAASKKTKLTCCKKLPLSMGEGVGGEAYKAGNGRALNLDWIYRPATRLT